MSTNAAAAERLSTIATLLEILGEDKFRVFAHQKAARAVEAMTQDLTTLAQNKWGGAALLKIDGIGPKTADKLIEFVTTGTMAELEELKAKVPAGLLEVLAIPGMGPKTVALVWKDLGVVDLAGLKAAIADGRLLTLPRMGEKAVGKIKMAIEMLAQSAGRLRLGIAMPIAQRVAAQMHNAKGAGVKRAAFAGSLRRGKETIGDIDILVVAADAQKAAEAFCTMPGVRQVIAKGENKCSVRMSIDLDESRWSGDPEMAGSETKAAGGVGVGVADADAVKRPTVQVDLRVIPASSWGAALMYFTGSKEHNIKLRERAQKMGLTLNEYGLFPDDKAADKPPQQRGVKAVASATEESIFTALGLAFVPPELREDRGETELKATPRLIEVADITSELHAHTTASDGSMSIVELAEHMKSRGMHTIAVTDHSQSSAIAGGLKPKALREHIAAIAQAQKAVKGITLLAGSEVDILASGELDYQDDLLAELELVVASPHSGLLQDSETATKRLLKAIAHPLVHILGHPTGRLINRRRGLEPDMAAVIAAAKEHDVALEINAHWMRLDLRDTHVKAAVEAGCLIAINCDVHAKEDADNLLYGVTTARRGWLTPEQCINTWTAAKLHGWLKKKRQ